MGRTHTFDVEQSIGIATRLFWRGYQSTSMAELTGAMGIGPASFYHTFESKEALFRQVVQRYIASLDAAYQEAFRSEDTLAAVRNLLRRYADVVTDPSHTAGCLVVNSSPAAHADDALQQWLASHREALRLRLQERFTADRRAGQLAGSTSPRTMARLVLALAAGVAVEASAGASRRDLYAMVDLAIRFLSEGAGTSD